MLIKAALNGSRTRAEHPAIPVTPKQQAIEAKAALEAGAGAIHVHIYGSDGQESLKANDLSKSLEAIRAACPGVPIGVSTAAWIVPSLEQRLSLINTWEVLPDFASVNIHEEGAIQVAMALINKGVAVEAGVWNKDAAALLLESQLASKCLRVLIELLEQDVVEALAHLEKIEPILDNLQTKLPRLLHGENVIAWDLVRVAAARGYDTRIGFEDVLTLPDGSYAESNAVLVATACQIAAEASVVVSNRGKWQVV